MSPFLMESLAFQEQKMFLQSLLPFKTNLNASLYEDGILDDLRSLDPTGYVLHTFLEERILLPISKEVKILILQDLLDSESGKVILFDQFSSTYKWISESPNPSPMDYLIAPSIKVGGDSMLMNILGPMDIFLSFLREYILYNAITKDLSSIERLIGRIDFGGTGGGGELLSNILVMLNDLKINICCINRVINVSALYWPYKAVYNDKSIFSKDGLFILKSVETLYAINFVFDNGKKVSITCPEKKKEFIEELFKRFPESNWPISIRDIKCSFGSGGGLEDDVEYFRGLLYRFLDSDLLDLVTNDDCEDSCLPLDLSFDDDPVSTNNLEAPQSPQSPPPLYISMVEGMLLNLGKSNINRIHQMLQMFLTDFSLSITELEGQLDEYLLKDEELYTGRKGK